jgi:hypothetical protein
MIASPHHLDRAIRPPAQIARPSSARGRQDLLA